MNQAGLVLCLSLLGCGAKPTVSPPPAPVVEVKDAVPPPPRSPAPAPLAPEGWAFTGPDDAKRNQMEGHFPRVEIYSEVDYGSANSGSDKNVGPDGKIQHMGRGDHQPFVDRASYLLDKKDVAALLATKLVFLPYFKETRPERTLKDYFDVAASKHLPAYREFFPRHLEGFTSYPEADRASFNSLVEYQKHPPTSLEIIWISPDQWYVNNVFYRAEYDSVIAGKVAVVDRRLVRGGLRDFIRFSPVVQQKIGEGFNYLRLPQALREPMQDTVVLVLQKTPGSPGTEDWEYTLRFDGELSHATVRLPHHRVAALLMGLETLDPKPLMSQRPMAHVDDGQVLIFRAWLWPPLTFGPGGGEMPAPFAAYFEAAKALLMATAAQQPDHPR